MAKGRRRRAVVWRAVGAVAHCWVVGQNRSACGGFGLAESGRRDGEEECRSCRIVLDQLW